MPNQLALTAWRDAMKMNDAWRAIFGGDEGICALESTGGADRTTLLEGHADEREQAKVVRDDLAGAFLSEVQCVRRGYHLRKRGVAFPCRDEVWLRELSGGSNQAELPSLAGTAYAIGGLLQGRDRTSSSRRHSTF